MFFSKIMVDGTVYRDLFVFENENQPLLNAPPSGNNENFSVTSLGHVCLLTFWRHSLYEWFFHVEAVFANYRLRFDISKTNHVVAALNDEGFRSVCDLLGLNVCHESLKQRLITTFAVLQSSWFRSIVQPGGLEDRRPTQLLCDMRAILLDGIGEDALKQFWLQKLSSSTSVIISGQDGSLEQADAVDVRNTSHQNIAALTRQIANLVTLQSSNQATGHVHNRLRSRSKSRSGDNSGLLTITTVSAKRPPRSNRHAHTRRQKTNLSDGGK